MKKRVTVTHFTTKSIRTYLYITCNKKILFVKKYLSLLWVFTDFSILLVAAMTLCLAIDLLTKREKGHQDHLLRKMEKAELKKTMIARCQAQMLLMAEGLQ